MDTVTYPDAEVQAYLNEQFVSLRFNTAEPAQVRELMREFRPQWTPTFVFLDHHKIEVRRVVGYLPPREFLAELRMGRANALLVNGKHAEAYGVFREVVEQFGDTAVAPEAYYYAGVAAFGRDGKSDQMRVEWTELKEKFPRSTWWTRASFIAK